MPPPEAFANFVVSMAQAGLAAGTAANVRKGASKGGSAAGLFFLLLGLSFFILMDYNARFGGALSGASFTGTIFKFLMASVLLSATGFIPYVVLSRKGNAKAKKFAGAISSAVYVLISLVSGAFLGRNTDDGLQSVILTNMYVLLGSILGFNAQAARSDQGAMSNSVMAAIGLILLALFDAKGSNKGTGAAEVKTPGAEEVANADLAKLEKAVTNAQAAINKAGEILDNNTEEMKAGKLALQQKLKGAQEALETYKAAPKA